MADKDFGLKKYVFKKAVGPYKEGAIVAFDEQGAKYFKEHITPFEEKKVEIKKK